MLPAPHRLRRRADFTSVVRGPGGQRAGSPHLVVHSLRTDARAECPPRVGFVVSKAVGNAVVRNRTKRRLRGLMASRLGGIPVGTDLVIRANPAAAQADSDELGASLDRALGRLLRRAG